MSSWESLSNDVGYLIIDRLPEVVEHVRFGAVCRRWHSITGEYHKLEKSRRRPLPMLLTPPNTIAGTKPNLYALSCRGNLYKNLKLPLPYAYRYCGSSHGWLATQNPDCSVTLEYPFGEKVSYIHLPVLDARLHRCFFPEFTIHRLIVSPDSSKDDYTVVVVYGGQSEIATIKSGEESWFLVKPAYEDRELGTAYSDIIFHKGLVYAVTAMHRILAFDFSVRPPKVIRLLSKYESPGKRFYLVESTHMDLFLVERHIDEKTKDEGEYNDEEYFEEEYDEEDAEPFDAEEYLEDYEASWDDEEEDDEEEDEEEDDEENEEEENEEEEDNDGEEDDEGEMHEMVQGGIDIYRPLMLTLSFKVYKLKTDTLSGKITGKIEVRNLKGDAFFVGDNMSESFPAATCSGCEPDTIYFTDDFFNGDSFEPDGPDDVGSYNMVKKSFDKHYIPKSSQKHMPPATWIFPPFPVYHSF